MVRMTTHLERFDPSATYVARKPLQLPRDATFKRGERVPIDAIGGEVTARRLYVARHIMEEGEYIRVMGQQPTDRTPTPSAKPPASADDDTDF